MATAVKTTPYTAVDEVRHLLAQCEDRLVKLKGPGAAAELFAGLDRLAELWPEISQGGADVRGEWTRWETLQAQLRGRGSKVLAAWGGKHALGDARAAAAPDQSHWWWWLDEMERDRRIGRVRKAAGLTAAVVVLVVLGGLLLSRLFPVDEAVREAYRHRTDAEAAILTGDYRSALDSMRQAAAARPDESSLQVMVGVLAELAGDSTTAAQAWDAGRTLLGGREDQFLVQRAMAYGQTNQFEKSAADALAAIAIDPASARAYLYLGAAYEGQGKTAEAVQAFAQADELAGDTDPELTVLARTRMAALLRSGPLSSPTVAVP